MDYTLMRCLAFRSLHLYYSPQRTYVCIYGFIKCIAYCRFLSILIKTKKSLSISSSCGHFLILFSTFLLTPSTAMNILFEYTVIVIHCFKWVQKSCNLKSVKDFVFCNSNWSIIEAFILKLLPPHIVYNLYSSV